MSSLQGTGAEGTYRGVGGDPSSRCGDQLCQPARLTPYLGLCMARVPCPRANQISPWGPISSAPLPWLSPCLSTAWPDAPAPEGPSVSHFCFHSLLGPCLLEAPSLPWPHGWVVPGPVRPQASPPGSQAARGGLASREEACLPLPPAGGPGPRSQGLE